MAFYSNKNYNSVSFRSLLLRFFNFFILYFGFVLWTWDNNTYIHTSAHTKWTYLCSAHCFDAIPSTGCILFNIISLCDFSIFLFTYIGCSFFHSSLLFYRSICFDFSTWASFHIFPLFLQKKRLDCMTQCQIFDFGFLVAFAFYSVNFRFLHKSIHSRIYDWFIHGRESLCHRKS